MLLNLQFTFMLNTTHLMHPSLMHTSMQPFLALTTKLIEISFFYEKNLPSHDNVIVIKFRCFLTLKIVCLILVPEMSEISVN